MIFSKGKKDYSKYHFFQNNSQIEIVDKSKATFEIEKC
jgi:hypothetical protein